MTGVQFKLPPAERHSHANHQVICFKRESEEMASVRAVPEDEGAILCVLEDVVGLLAGEVPPVPAAQLESPKDPREADPWGRGAL